jgi:hypothetical protein
MDDFKNNLNFSPAELEEVITDIRHFHLNVPTEIVKENLWLMLRSYIYNTSESGGSSEIGDMLLFYERLVELIEALAKLASLKSKRGASSSD